ncbi:heme exporter protein CcmD [Pseudooceanicola atlanticus]|uniref:Heme exporter protein D n=1 Tax=Pseudooceanicola atlanticus TaxID=1461694 RepID=A0A0A0EAL1_9RHOB|nr:heme exporter protein CcmD [Pseudooceanicola atlanticus]KGM47981.1 hemagglutination activity protein [Pseudooceanicola atlanticus]
MMPELGKYAGAVLSSYGLSLALLIALIWYSLWRSRRVAKSLKDVEDRVKNG